jgi:hypothetical protein
LPCLPEGAGGIALRLAAGRTHLVGSEAPLRRCAKRFAVCAGARVGALHRLRRGFAMARWPRRGLGAMPDRCGWCGGFRRQRRLPGLALVRRAPLPILRRSHKCFPRRCLPSLRRWHRWLRRRCLTSLRRCHRRIRRPRYLPCLRRLGAGLSGRLRSRTLAPLRLRRAAFVEIL